MGRIEPAEMVPGRDLVSMESSDAEGLPQTSAAAWHTSESAVRGAAKFLQLGSDCCGKLLDATVDHVSLQHDGAWLLVDTHPYVGDMLEAFLFKRMSSNRAAFYIGLLSSDDVGKSDVISEAKIQKLARLAMEGQLSLPGLTGLQQEMSASDLGDPPQPPSLSVLQQNPEGGMLMAPPPLVNQYKGAFTT